jgi:hypothetical protein
MNFGTDDIILICLGLILIVMIIYFYFRYRRRMLATVSYGNVDYMIAM